MARAYIDPQTGRLRLEIEEDFGRQYLRRDFAYRGHRVLVMKQGAGFAFKVEGRYAISGQAATGPQAEAQAKAYLDNKVERSNK